MTHSEHAEQVLVRRVVTGVCLVALLTVPVVHQVLGAFDSWISVAHLGVFAGAFALLGRGRLGLGPVVAMVGSLLLLVALVSMAGTSSAAFTGDGDGVGLGTGLLWVMAGLAPVVALAFPLRWVAVAGIAAVAAAALVVVGAARWQWAAVAAHPGVVALVVDAVVVLGTTLVVAWLARRRAIERYRAHQRRRAAADRIARLDAEQRRRAEMFTRTAAQLRVPMDELVDLAGDLDAHDGDPLLTRLERVEALAVSMRDRVVDELDALVDALRAAGAAEQVDPGADPAAPTIARRGTTALAVLLVGLVVADVWRVLELVGTGTDPHVLAAGANRMVTVLFVATAVLVLRVPGRPGWVLTGAVLLLHPVAVLLLAPAAARPALLSPYLSSWRIALLAAATLALLAEVIQRRVDERERLDLATAAAAVRATEQARRDAMAEQAYAEAAHELKNPLTVIGGAAALVRRRASEVTPDQLGSLRTSLTGAIDRLDRRLAAMDAAAGGEQAAQGRRAVAVTEQPAAATGVLTRAVGAALEGIEPPPVVDLTQLEATTRVAPTALQHVMENLLGNAVKHGDGATTRVTVDERADHVLVTVANRGGHLTPEEAARVFEPYWRAGATDGAAVEGSGLGLAIVARLVADWGGRCWAEVDDGWTRIHVTVPTEAGVLVGAGPGGGAAQLG